MSRARPAPKGKDQKQTGPVLSKLEQDAVQKSKAVKDTQSEEFKLAMRKELRDLKKIHEQQQKLMNYFQQQREKINYNWIIAKKELQDKKSQLTNKKRQIEDLFENHTMTLNLYKQKIKHVMLIRHDQQSTLRKDVEITLKQLQDQHRIRERSLKTDLRSLQTTLKEQETSQNDYIFALKSQNDKTLTETRQQFDRQLGQLKKKYDLKNLKVRAQMQNYRKGVVKMLQERKDEKIKRLTMEHTKKYSDIKAYYTEITATNLDLIKQLRNEISQLHKKQQQNKRLLNMLERQRRELMEPLKQLQIEIKKLQQDLKKQQVIVQQKDRIKANIDKEQAKIKDIQYQYEVKLQSYTFKQKQRDRLFTIFNDTVYSIHQKQGLNNLILEKKLSAVSEELEIKNLQLSEILKSAHIDGRAVGAISKSIEQIESSKEELIQDLQNQLQQIRRAHTHMVKAYEGKLAEFVIPVEELGFDPLVPTNVE